MTLKYKNKKRTRFSRHEDASVSPMPAEHKNMSDIQNLCETYKSVLPQKNDDPVILKKVRP